MFALLFSLMFIANAFVSEDLSISTLVKGSIVNEEYGKLVDIGTYYIRTLQTTLGVVFYLDAYLQNTNEENRTIISGVVWTGGNISSIPTYCCDGRCIDTSKYPYKCLYELPNECGLLVLDSIKDTKLSCGDYMYYSLSILYVKLYGNGTSTKAQAWGYGEYLDTSFICGMYNTTKIECN